MKRRSTSTSSSTTSRPRTIDPDLEFTYANAGVEYRFNRVIAASLVYKNAEVEGGTFSTIAGNLGSNEAGAKGKYNEFGVWAVYDF